MDLEDRIVEITKLNRKEKKKKNLKNEGSLREIWDYVKHTNICVIRVKEV